MHIKEESSVIDQEMLNLAGVTLKTFALLQQIYEFSDGTKISADNRLLIF